MINFLKVIIICIGCFYIYHSLQSSIFNTGNSNNKFSEISNFNQCNHSYEYSKLEKSPTKEEEGIKMYMCKYCRNKYFETIPKLNKGNYTNENLTSNCENGNGMRY